MSKQHCTSCHAGMPTLSKNEIKSKLESISGWSYDEDNNCLSRTYQFKGYYKTMAFANAIAWIAHTEKHHPDMVISYNTLKVSFQTHEAGGITENDIICATLVNGISIE